MYPRSPQSQPNNLGTVDSLAAVTDDRRYIPYPQDFLRLLRRGHSPDHHEHENYYRKIQPFRFWILRLSSVQVLDFRLATERDSIQSIFRTTFSPNLKSNIENLKPFLNEYEGSCLI